MPSRSLRELARHLDVPERTLRRAATEGLVHGRRLSPRRFETSLREESYLRRQWPLLRELRDALRTEPNVRLAVLFGSQATGASTDRSDVDVLVALSDPTAARVAETTGRLERRLGRDVQLVRLQDAEQAPLVMSDALSHGRVLVDRDARWEQLKRGAPEWQRRAASVDLPLDEAMPASAMARYGSVNDSRVPHVTLAGDRVGEYVITEERADGTLVLAPEAGRLHPARP